MNKVSLSHLSGPKNSVFIQFVVRILLIAILAVGVSGCDITISSITVPSTALIGQTITIVLQGNGCDDNPFTSPDGLVLQIPDGTEVIGTDGLTEDSGVNSGYTAEPGYHLWGGKESTSPGGSCSDGHEGIIERITLKINDTVSPGTYYIKAAVRGFVNGAWTNMHPGSTNFAQISGSYQSNAMNITATGIGITSPNAEDWNIGNANTVSWIYSGTVGTTVNIDLYNGGSFYSPVATDVPIGSDGNGTFDWLIPCYVGSGFFDYQIKITSTSNSSYSVLSTFFSIWPPQISMTDPYFGETIYNNIAHRVQWAYPVCLDGTTVNIDLYNGGNPAGSVATGVDIGSGGNGYFDWTPETEVGTSYYLCVTPASTGSGQCTFQFQIATCLNKKVWMTTGPTQYYDSIQAAYDDNDETIGNVRDIYAQATDFPDGLVLDDADKTVTIYGGRDCSYESRPVHTTIHGVMTISRGTVVVDKLLIAS